MKHDNVTLGICKSSGKCILNIRISQQGWRSTPLKMIHQSNKLNFCGIQEDNELYKFLDKYVLIIIKWESLVALRNYLSIEYIQKRRRQ